MALTPKQERFVAEYLVDLNATQAAIRAGYSAKTADRTAWENLRKPEVAVAVSKGKARQLAKSELSATVVLEELRRLALSDIGDVSPAMREALPAEARSTISRIEAPDGTVLSVGEGDKRVALKGFSRWDKLRALEILAKHFRLADEHQHHHLDDERLLEILQAGREFHAKKKGDGHE